MVRRHKNVYRIENRFSFTRTGKGCGFVGLFFEHEHDGVVSWSFVFANMATQDAAANQWVTEQLYALNEVK